jgi:hypothetical protein
VITNRILRPWASRRGPGEAFVRMQMSSLCHLEFLNLLGQQNLDLTASCPRAAAPRRGPHAIRAYGC